MTADTAPVNARERLARAVVDHIKSLENYDAPYVDDDYLTSTVIDGRMDMLALGDALLAAGFGDVAQAKAEALEDAAASIPERMRLDELGMHQINYTADLPQLSRVMLNGATRFAERLIDRAAEYRTPSANGGK